MLERLARIFTPKPEIISPGEDREKAAVKGEFETQESPSAHMAPVEKVIIEKPKPDLKLVPLKPEQEADETAEWIQKTAEQERGTGEIKYAQAQARAREAQRREAIKSERTLDDLIFEMRELNIERAELEGEIEKANSVMNESIKALGRAGILKETVGAMRKEQERMAMARKRVAEVDKSIQSVEAQMDKALNKIQAEREAIRAAEMEKEKKQTQNILAGTEIAPGERAVIENWFVDPNAEFDSDVYEDEKSAVSPEVLTTLKSNSLLEIDKRKVQESVKNNRETLRHLELNRDQLEGEGKKKFGAVIGFNIEDLQIKKSAWGRLLFKARLGKLRNEFAKWEHDYNELSDKIKRANEEVIQDELYLKNPHQAAANEVRNITGILGRRLRSSAPTKGTRGISV